MANSRTFWFIFVLQKGWESDLVCNDIYSNNTVQYIELERYGLEPQTVLSIYFNKPSSLPSGRTAMPWKLQCVLHLNNIDEVKYFINHRDALSLFKVRPSKCVYRLPLPEGFDLRRSLPRVQLTLD